MADVLTPTVIQPIDVVRDTLAGINLTRINSYDLNFPNPAAGWSDLYESNSAVATLTSLLGDGTSVCGSANCLYDAIQTDSVQQPLAELLLDNTAPRIATSLSPLTTQLQSFATIFYNQMGNLDPSIAYYQGAYPCVRYSSMANLIMMSPAATSWQKQQAKHFLGFCAGFLWDQDFFSTDPSVGGGLGNQQTQFLQQKAQFATELSSNPDMQPLVQQSVANIEVNLLANINAYGSGYASWHYQGATTDQALFGWLNLAATGQLNIANFPQVALFGQWYMSGITPPEVRFGNTRMYISNGDGNTESESSPGLLATLLRPAYPALASNLAYIWASQGYSDQDIGSFAAPSLRNRQDAENLSDQALLREVMNTVGKPGRLGESIRCVVSVSMLTEGWDARARSLSVKGTSSIVRIASIEGLKSGVKSSLPTAAWSALNSALSKNFLVRRAPGTGGTFSCTRFSVEVRKKREVPCGEAGKQAH